MILYDSLGVSLTWCLTCVIFHISWYIVSDYVIPGFSDIKNKNQKKMWYNRGVSTIHACVMFSITRYYWVYINPTVQILGKG
jgi:hypothetical protein